MDVVMKSIFLFGATGKSGKKLLQQALDIGHTVTVLARTPERLDEFKEYKNFHVIRGDALIKSTYENDIKGADVVISCLGATTLSMFSTSTFFIESIKGIHEAMVKQGITRFIGMSSWATQDDPNLSFFARWFLRPILLRRILADLWEMETYLENTTGLNYTIVRPAGLTEAPISGQEIFVEVGKQCIPACKESIARNDVAAFMLKCLHTDEYDQKIVAIGVK